MSCAGSSAFRRNQPRDLLAVFVAAAGEVDDDQPVLRQSRGELKGLGQGVGGFQRREDPFELRARLKRVHGLVVGDADVLDAAGVLPVGVLGADAGVVEAGGDGVDVGGLAVVVLEDVGKRPVEDARPPLREAGGVLSQRPAPAARLDADEADFPVGGERRLTGPGVARGR